ncbi:MAG: decarboxylase [Hyphomicrobiales bacterium]|nr:decarboxylase [Hyphomicrobiales bacterium]
MKAANAAPRLSGALIIEALSAAGVRTVAALPDITTSHGLLWPLSRRKDLRLIRVCKEDEGVTICSALSYCNHRAVMLMQQTGLLDSLNAVAGIAVEYHQPVCMIVGMLGKTGGVAPEDNRKYSVRIVPPVLRAMGVDHLCLESDADIPDMVQAIHAAYERSRPLVVLLGSKVQP